LVTAQDSECGGCGAYLRLSCDIITQLSGNMSRDKSRKK
jgi:hypothetical protein